MPPRRPGRQVGALHGRLVAAFIAGSFLVAGVLLLSLVSGESFLGWPWSVQQVIGLAGLLALLAAAVATGWIVFAARLAQPVERLAAAARRMTGGATLVQVGPHYSPGEIGIVERAFDAMVETVVHQKAEAEEARRILDDAIRSLSEAVVLYDAGERLVFCNERSYELFHPIRHLMVPGARLEDLVRALVERIDEGASDAGVGERADGIIRCFRARERNVIERYGQRWLRISYSATSDGGTVVAIVDVTDLLGREHELEAINRRIMAYAESSADWFWELDASFRFTFTTPGPGLHDPRDVIGKTRWELDSAPEVNAPLWPAHQARLHRREPFRDFRFRVRELDGRLRTMSISGLPIYDAEGAFEGYCGIGRDLTEEVEAVESLRLSEARFRTLAETAPTGIYRMDASGTVVFANEIWRQTTASAGLPLTPEAWRAAVHADDAERVAASREEALKAGRDFREEYRVRRPDGSVRWVLDAAAPERDSAGNVAGFVGTLADITEKREIEARLEQSRRLEALGQLTGGIAHDFNNLLMVVLGNAEMLEDLANKGGEIKPDRLLRLARTILSAAERGTALTQNLLGFARRRSVSPEKVAVHQKLQELGELLRRNLGGKIPLVFDLSAERDEVMIDVTQFENAVINVALNARDAMGESGRLTITTRNLIVDAPGRLEDGELATGRYIAVDIADTGMGMTPEVAMRAVEPFFTTKGEKHSTGLGLSLAYGVVKQAKGELRIDTAPGRGATVTLIVPLVDQMPAGQQTSVPRDYLARPEPLAGRPRVLVVDDDPPVLSVMTQQLERLGCEAIGASSAEGALRLLLADQSFDLMFSDIDLGAGHDGLTLAREVRSLRPSLPILLTTGKLMDRGESDEHPPILPKPFTQRELAEKLREILEPAS